MSAVMCSSSTTGILAQSCPAGSAQPFCVLQSSSCTQLQSPSAANGQGADACFAMCPASSCDTAAYTKQGECLIFNETCCTPGTPAP